ncbi:hypothetical protein EC991_006320 [Linnemannia zychae]|nr:hypothetical protein EC991_006320 [Linnemannia zychae]
MPCQIEANNNNGRAAESLRDISRRDTVQTSVRPFTPVQQQQQQEKMSTTKVKTLSSKVTLAKRISRLFSGGSKSSKKSPSPLSSDATASTSDIEEVLQQTKLSSIEVINDVSRQELQLPNMTIHQRSQSSPDHTGITHGHALQSRRAATRENSLDAIEVGNHRRYSSSTGPSAPTTPTTPTSSFPYQRQRSPSTTNSLQHSNRSSVSGIEDTDLNQQPYRPYSQDQRHTPLGSPVLEGVSTSTHSRNSSDNVGGTSPRPTTPMEDHLRARRSTVNDASSMLPVPARAAPPRRSSTPLVVSETLVSRIDREKSTVCFQTPSTKRDSYSRDANLDPALTSLVQQHRKDYQTNLRLGGVPESIPQSMPHIPIHATSQPFLLPQINSSPLLMNSVLPIAQNHVPASRRDSNVPLLIPSPLAGPQSTHASGVPTPGTPGPFLAESHPHRASGSHVQGGHHPYTEAKGLSSGSHGNLLNAAAVSSAKLQQQQQQLQQSQNHHQFQHPSPQLTPQGQQVSQGKHHRPNPKRQPGSGYFNVSPQQKPHSFPSSTNHGSPFPSPVVGATGSSVYAPELSVAMQYQQYQQQQVQLQIQQQQLQHLQQQQQLVQQQGQYTQVSPLALLQNQSAQQQQLQHQQQQQQNQQLGQLEQLQQIRIQQQQLLLQQQQQLQQQLEQARVTISTTAASTATTAAVDNAMLNAISQQQQSQLSMANQGVPLHFALPAAPVLTTAMGMGMGMGMGVGMSPLNVMGMGMGLQPTTMVPQLVMTPPLTPQLLGYTTPMYSYQQIPAGVVPTATPAANGGANAVRSPVVMGY